MERQVKIEKYLINTVKDFKMSKELRGYAKGLLYLIDSNEDWDSVIWGGQQRAYALEAKDDN